MTAGSILWWLAPIYLLLVNAMTYLMFWIDKERAQTRQYRIPEGKLLLLAALGGSPAALFARQHLRHKTRKQPFGAALLGIVALQLSAAIWLAMS
jgi:uncharacterized membrane protein YsdA (DUF1294 family)